MMSRDSIELLNAILQFIGQLKIRESWELLILILKWVCVTVIKNIALKTYEIRLIADNNFLVNIKE